MDPTASILPLDRKLLTLPVQRALGSATAEVLDWHVRPLTHLIIVGITGGVYRVVGSARDKQATHPWSLIVKVARDPGHDLPQTHWLYWKREWLAYQAGLLAHLPGRLVAPRCYGVTERPGEGGWLWLEEIIETVPHRWPLDAYATAARDLGTFNGAYLVGHPRPVVPWLCPDFIRQVAAPGSWWATHMDPGQPGNFWEHALVQRLVPRATQERVLAVWAAATELIATLERLPQTLCHFDAHRRNLLLRAGADGELQTVAIDWIFAGPGPVGADIGDLVLNSAFFFEVAPEEVARLDAVAFPAYVTGLRAVGWDGEAWQARLGYCGYVALRYAACLPGWIALQLAGAAQAATVQNLGRTVDEIAAGWLLLTEYALERADEARALATRC